MIWKEIFVSEENERDEIDDEEYSQQICSNIFIRIKEKKKIWMISWYSCDKWIWKTKDDSNKIVSKKIREECFDRDENDMKREDIDDRYL